MLRRRETAALYISHDLALVAQLADRIAVLQSGRLVEFGATEKVLRHPREPYTRQLLAARRRWEPASVGENQDGRQPILALTSVSASYRAMPGVLREISFSLFPGRRSPSSAPREAARARSRALFAACCRRPRERWRSVGSSCLETSSDVIASSFGACR